MKTARNLIPLMFRGIYSYDMKLSFPTGSSGILGSENRKSVAKSVATHIFVSTNFARRETAGCRFFCRVDFAFLGDNGRGKPFVVLCQCRSNIIPIPLCESGFRSLAYSMV